MFCVDTDAEFATEFSEIKMLCLCTCVIVTVSLLLLKKILGLLAKFC